MASIRFSSKTVSSYVLVLLILAGFAIPAQANDQGEVAGESSRATVRVLIVGDSWAQLMLVAGSLRDVFAAEGRPDIQERGAVTAISGTTASEWATSGFLQLITDELIAYPDVDTVQITIGGNDLLDGESGGGWWAGMPQGDEEALFAQVLADLAAVVDHTLALDPEIQVIVSLYDYPNFEDIIDWLDPFGCVDRWHDLNQPTPLEVATAMTQLQSRATALVASRPRTSIVSHLGLMQWVFLGIPPPGDPTQPSPVEAMLLGLDCIHLSPDGYFAVAQNLWERFYRDHFNTIFVDGFEDGDSTAWSTTLP